MSSTTTAPLSDLVPTEDTSAAIREAIARTDRRRDAELERRAAASRERAEALSTFSMSPKVVHRCETELHEVGIQLERVGIIRARLYERLQVAIERERVEAQEAEIAAARTEYSSAVTAFRDALPDYERAAATICAVILLEQAQQRAGDRFRSAVLATLPVGATLPADPRAAIGAPHLNLAGQTVLPPARPRAGFIWRQEPPSVHPDAIRYRAEARYRGR